MLGGGGEEQPHQETEDMKTATPMWHPLLTELESPRTPRHQNVFRFVNSPKSSQVWEPVPQLQLLKVRCLSASPGRRDQGRSGPNATSTSPGLCIFIGFQMILRNPKV